MSAAQLPLSLFRFFRRSQTGATTLFFVVVGLPLLLLGYFIALDLRSFSSREERLQQAVDFAARSAVAQLPYVSRAENAAKLAVHTFGEDPAKLTLTQTPLGFELRLSGESSTLFASYLAMLARSAKLEGYDLQAVSRFASRSAESVILIDAASDSVAPSLLGPAWSNSSESPTCQWFIDQSGKVVPGTIDPRLLSQQCFNPLFSSIKRAALLAYRWANSFGQARTAIGVSGSNAALVLLRSLEPSEVPEVTGGEGVFLNYLASSGYRSDLYCLAAALSESGDSPNKIPAGRSDLARTGWQKEFYTTASLEGDPPAFNEAYANQLSVEEAVWSLAARDGFSADITAILNRALGVFTNSLKPVVKNETSRQLVIFSGALPLVSTGKVGVDAAATADFKAFLNGFSKRAADLGIQSLTISYVILDWSGGTVSKGDLSTLNAEIAAELALAASEATENKNQAVTFSFLLSGDATSLDDVVIPRVLSAGREALLGR